MNEANSRASKKGGPLLTDRTGSQQNSPKDIKNKELNFEPQKVSIFLRKNSKSKTPF